jgi:hypothetical protein
VVRSGDRLVKVPWRSISFDVPAEPQRVMSTSPRSRLPTTGSRLEREPVVVQSVPVVPVRPLTVPVIPRRDLIVEPRSGDVLDDYLHSRYGFRTTPGWRPADLLKDRFEARRAPPLAPWPRPTYVWRAPTSSIP